MQNKDLLGPVLQQMSLSCYLLAFAVELNHVSSAETNVWNLRRTHIPRV
jgi:hypothetical protein